MKAKGAVFIYMGILMAAVSLTGLQAQSLALGYHQQGVASYGPNIDGIPTESGELYKAAEFTAAHRDLAFGTLVLVTSIDNGKQAVVKINDRGPQSKDYIVEVSYAAAQRLGMIDAGTANVVLTMTQTDGSALSLDFNKTDRPAVDTTALASAAAAAAPSAPASGAAPDAAPASAAPASGTASDTRPAAPAAPADDKPEVVAPATLANTAPPLLSQGVVSAPPANAGAAPVAPSVYSAGTGASAVPAPYIPAVPATGAPAANAASPTTPRQILPVAAAARPPSSETHETLPPGSEISPVQRPVLDPSSDPLRAPVVKYPAATVLGDIVSGRSYRIQVGSFKVTRNAVDVFDRLRAAGFSPAYERNGEYYRIVIPGVRGEDMVNAAKTLGQAGFAEVIAKQE
jgi:rare lipoprotein A (peptidoglycan hydrolase)